jgi:hypothetical protein
MKRLLLISTLGLSLASCNALQQAVKFSILNFTPGSPACKAAPVPSKAKELALGFDWIGANGLKSMRLTLSPNGQTAQVLTFDPVSPPAGVRVDPFSRSNHVDVFIDLNTVSTVPVLTTVPKPNPVTLYPMNVNLEATSREADVSNPPEIKNINVEECFILPVLTSTSINR